MAEAFNQAILTPGLEYDRIQHLLKVRRDAGATVLLGPVRLAVATLGTLFLFRVILRRAGLEVVGLWSLLNVVTVFISLLDMGFSQLLARDMHVGDSREQMREHWADMRAVAQAYWTALFVLVLPAVLLLAWWMPSLPYDRLGLAGTLVLIATGTLFQLLGKLEASVLAAYQDNAYVQIIQLLSLAVGLAVAITGAYRDVPLEGFALGLLLSSILGWALLRRRVTQRGLRIPSGKLPARQAVERVVRLARAGGGFYSMSVSWLLREPCFRLIIASLLGVKALGAFAIGFRASVATRDFVSSGFSVLYPAIASLYRAGNRAEIATLQAGALVVLMTLGSAALACLYGFAEPALTLLLGPLPEGILAATRILVVWNLITLFNIPFDYFLNAAGHEKAAAFSLWLHTASILLLWPLRWIWDASLNSLLVYWTLTSMATQGLICYYVQSKLRGFWPIVRLRPVWGTLLLALFYWIVVAVWTSQAQAPDGLWRQFAVLARVLLPATVVFVASAFFISRAMWAKGGGLR